MVAVGFYFERKRALATGIASSGAGCGIVVMSLLAAYLLDFYDWRNALLILAGVVWHSAIAGALCRPLTSHPVVTNVDVEKTSKSTSDIVSSPSVNQTLLRAALMNSQASSNAGGITRPLPGPRTSHVRTVSENLCESTATRNQHTKHMNGSFQSNSIQEHQKHKSNRHELPITTSKTDQDNQHYFSTYEMGDKSADSTSFLKKQRTTSRSTEQHQLSPRIARKDIFYSGSVTQLSEFRSNASLQDYIASVTIPAADDDEERFVCGCIPARYVDTARRMLDLSLLRERALIFIALSNGLWQAGYMIPLVFVPDFALSIGISARTASVFISILGISPLYLLLALIFAQCMTS